MTKGSLVSWLKKLTIIQLTVGTAFFLVILVVVLVFNEIASSQKRLESAEQDSRLIALLDSLEKLAHNHAVERGLTAGYLGAPSPQAKAKVDDQRTKADLSVN